MAKPRLKIGDITLQQVLDLSKMNYKKDSVDNKIKRQSDILTGKTTTRNNLYYNRATKTWEQTGREVKFEFIVTSDPKSYKRPKWDKKRHKYPVTFLLRNFDAGMNSPFRWRTGSMIKPRLPKKGDDAKKRKKLMEFNLQRGRQLDFFFHIEYVSYRHKTLFGPNLTGWAPKITNPDLLLYFDKTAYFVVVNFLRKLLTYKKGAILNKSFKAKK